MHLAAITLFLLSFIASVHAHVLQKRDIRLSSWDIGDIILDVLYILVYLACIVVGTKVARNLPGHRAPFIILIVASCLSILHLILLIPFRIVNEKSPGIVNEDSPGIFDSTSSADRLLSGVVFFQYWSYSILYLALALVLFDRHRSILLGAFNKQDKIAFGALFLVNAAFVAVATITAAMYAIGVDSVDRFSFGLQILLAVFSTIWGITTIAVSWTAGYVNSRSRRIGERDKVSRLMLVAITPLIIILFAIGVTMTWLPFLVLATLLVDGLFCAITITLLALGMRPELWRHKSSRVEELEGPAVNAGYANIDGSIQLKYAVRAN
ncbi:uncharacterized protein FOMMEDRAFT_142325 [Fomitiporia mediterranea MF3/22]|uniref:uncharacterized protein n=1 Tax=Fomitiporia mediterranea (strain MF3/22) TaxID=694068 RepID=UPI0004409A38|nr:uncharacterized protein FOMMEDRAFT_142325 [Fomitiporia mediterranea MF3/22]EJD00374.1 hypothetical protein FOMMEDRAFT_142325 [Fomitiporia mediterranea MF3/22]